MKNKIMINRLDLIKPAIEAGYQKEIRLAINDNDG